MRKSCNDNLFKSTSKNGGEQEQILITLTTKENNTCTQE